MIRADQIPDEAIAAFDRVFLEERRSGWTLDTTYRHAIAAALGAWPKSYSLAESDSAVIRNVAALILPLPTEDPQKNPQKDRPKDRPNSTEP